MPIYEVICDDGHRDEVLRAIDQPMGDCPVCGSPRHKLISSFGVVGRASLPSHASRMPQTWRGTHEGNPGYLHHLQGVADRRRRLEERHPELRGDDRPIVAHEGRFEDAPLRAGDVVGRTTKEPGDGAARTPAHHHRHSHGHAPDVDTG